MPKASVTWWFSLAEVSVNSRPWLAANSAPSWGERPDTDTRATQESREDLVPTAAWGRCHRVHWGLFVSPFPAFLRSAQFPSKARPASQVRPVQNQGLWLMLPEGSVPMPLSPGGV